MMAWLTSTATAATTTVAMFLTSFIVFICQQQPVVNAQVRIEPLELYEGIQSNRWAAVVDVRRVDEWEVGHIESATFVPNLASTSENAYLIDGCQTTNCEIVIYCRSGARASEAINRLQTQEGYENVTLWNGQGTSQWTTAGYPLVNDPSVVPDCAATSMVAQPKCELADTTTTTPTTSPVMAFPTSSSIPSDMPSDVPSTVPSSSTLTSTALTTTSPTTSPSTTSSSASATTTANADPLPVITLTPDEFNNGIQSGLFNIIIDVRSEEEWITTGHIDGATLIADLATSGVVPTLLVNPPAYCRSSSCNIAVYCNSGGRAAAAIQRLQTEFGFLDTQFYNGLGIRQWTDAGYALVDTDSVIPSCASTVGLDSLLSSSSQRTTTTEGQICMSCCERNAMCCNDDSSMTSMDGNDSGGSSSTTNGLESGDPSSGQSIMRPTMFRLGWIFCQSVVVASAAIATTTVAL